MNHDLDKSDLYRSYEFIREKVVHEDDLVHQRLTWLITFNGLLFTAFGFSLNAESASIASMALTGSPTSVPPMQDTVDRLRQGLIIAGVGSSVASYIGITAACRRIRRDRLAFYDHVNLLLKEEIRLPWIPRLTGHGITNTLGMLCGLLVPMTVSGTWIYVGWTWVSEILSTSNYAALSVSLVFFLVLGVSFYALWPPKKSKVPALPDLPPDR